MPSKELIENKCGLLKIEGQMVVTKVKLPEINKEFIIRNIWAQNLVLKVKKSSKFAVNLNSDSRQKNKVDIESHGTILKFAGCNG